MITRRGFFGVAAAAPVAAGLAMTGGAALANCRVVLRNEMGNLVDVVEVKTTMTAGHIVKQVVQRDARQCGPISRALSRK